MPGKQAEGQGVRGPAERRASERPARQGQAKSSDATHGCWDPSSGRHVRGPRECGVWSADPPGAQEKRGAVVPTGGPEAPDQTAWCGPETSVGAARTTGLRKALGEPIGLTQAQGGPSDAPVQVQGLELRISGAWGCQKGRP